MESLKKRKHICCEESTTYSRSFNCISRVNERLDFKRKKMGENRALTHEHLMLGNVEEFPCQIQYASQKDGVYSTSQNIHAGQRKLLMSEIQFMTRVHIERSQRYRYIQADSPFLCIYAGACPCTHLDMLMEMFPNVCFVLVDPAFSKLHHAQQVRRWDPRRVVVWNNNFNSTTVKIINAWRKVKDVGM